MELKGLFDSWASSVNGTFDQRQWMLSKWEVLDGVDWPDEKVGLMMGEINSGLRLKKTSSLVDLGCGGGWIESYLSDECSNIVGLDLAPSMLTSAKKVNPDREFVCGDLCKLPFMDESFDRVLCYFVFINFCDENLFYEGVKEIFRVLQPGGVALIGQLPDREGSSKYEAAKAAYQDFCCKEYSVRRDMSDDHKIPICLYDRNRLVDFFEQEGISYCFRDSFNPFYHPGATATVDWRFDVIIEKGRD